ncbi:sugar transferase [Jiulongibacter sediminis]|uniref:sugar transferase n=1 Tax=Jiulongibacter sediminis TaxID=1605367 RepID=UPI00286E9DBF|nr:sugar transferase [Jiulongibacter sediminis]
MKRLFDIFFSLFGLLLCFPLFVILAILIPLEDGGRVFFSQRRVGYLEKPFFILKFRTMGEDVEKYGQLTVGSKDHRITKIVFWLRKFKIDEIPQLINVLKGEMSIVGPRPEVEKYVSLYDDFQRKIFSVRPGITDNASIRFRNENELLANKENPEDYYISEIMPEKLRLNLEYIKKISLKKDVEIVIKTIIQLVRK